MTRFIEPYNPSWKPEFENITQVIATEFKDIIPQFDIQQQTRTNTAATNIVLAIGGLNGFVSTEVQSSASVLRLSVSAKKPRLWQCPNRSKKVL